MRQGQGSPKLKKRNNKYHWCSKTFYFIEQKLPEATLNANVIMIYCITMAIRYPNGFFQSNGNLDDFYYKTSVSAVQEHENHERTSVRAQH